jgi:pimeloyl-ACP methyl ester carboxylesterase
MPTTEWLKQFNKVLREYAKERQEIVAKLADSVIFRKTARLLMQEVSLNQAQLVQTANVADVVQRAMEEAARKGLLIEQKHQEELDQLMDQLKVVKLRADELEKAKAKRDEKDRLEEEEFAKREAEKEQPYQEPIKQKSISGDRAFGSPREASGLPDSEENALPEKNAPPPATGLQIDTGTSPLLKRDGENTPLSFAEFGLHCLRQPTSDTCVIFVHGILSSGDQAWGNPSWPELLQAEPQFKHVGIFIFTYRTSMISRTYSIADAADALREHFSIDGLWNLRNVVFVCHSMGGIVVRRFLVANQATLLELLPRIGVFLVASPSLGSRDGNILSILSFALQHTQAAVLRFSQANTSLDELHRDFKTLLNGGKLCIVGRELLEDRPIKLKRWLGLWRQTVEPFSASAYFKQPGCEPLRIPGSDHATIVKPLQPKALQHVALKRFLAKFPAYCGDRLGSRSS